jgi:NhaP-type Na+/H+ or K+/H+ antiporter
MALYTGDNDMEYFIRDILVGLAVGLTLGYLIFL